LLQTKFKIDGQKSSSKVAQPNNAIVKKQNDRALNNDEMVFPEINLSNQKQSTGNNQCVPSLSDMRPQPLGS
jgi:hypothetical protein